MSLSFLLFSPFLPPCFSSISICLSVLSTVSFFFAFTIPHYVLRCGSVDEWHIHSSAEDFRTQRCVCCEAVCFLTWLFACLCVMVTFVRSEPHKMACRHSLQLKIKHI
ncbi:EC1118_1E8_0166p [Saccharomyces cerevisiae EC1118]|uniref:EC1118_1E8_0166p n=1 Tax=Saccharomyces cerevisiae (strain Lalvin EC1118 / Prise de mousse) TaxID=643680 RepID=C8Z6T3_YEAS8|nr:EC1118_1E8_0166p [Saccharomyces cerevisiae EC1118]